MASETWIQVCVQCGEKFVPASHCPECGLKVGQPPAPCCEAAEIVAAMEELDSLLGDCWVSVHRNDLNRDEWVVSSMNPLSVDFDPEVIGRGPTRLAALQDAVAEMKRRENKKRRT